MNTSLKDTVLRFRAEGRGLAHFNISDSNQLKALGCAAKETGLPVIVGLSEGEREYFPLTHARAMVDQYCSEGVAMFLNADHTYGIEKVKEAIASGVDSVVVDGAKLPFEENTSLLKECVSLVRASGREVLVEGEHGYIGSSSNVVDALPDGVVVTEEMMTRPEVLKELVDKTGVDLVAPAVGNIHGMIRSGQPKLSILRIGELCRAIDVPMVLHGGSGSSDEEFAQAVKAGITIIHINTELRVLYRDELAKSIAANNSEAAPYKFLKPVVEKMTSYAVQKMRLFAS